jgi:hypothetical protein
MEQATVCPPPGTFTTALKLAAALMLHSNKRLYSTSAPSGPPHSIDTILLLLLLLLLRLRLLLLQLLMRRPLRRLRLRRCRV